MAAATSERSTVEVLRAAKERISDPERWCRGAFAKDDEVNDGIGGRTKLSRPESHRLVLSIYEHAIELAEADA